MSALPTLAQLEEAREQLRITFFPPSAGESALSAWLDAAIDVVKVLEAVKQAYATKILSLEEHLRSSEREIQRLGAWKTAIIDANVVGWSYRAKHEDDPKQAVADLLQAERFICLDPTISTAARELVEKAIGFTFEKTIQALHVPEDVIRIDTTPGKIREQFFDTL